MIPSGKLFRETEATNEAIQVLLLTYMRSGSSLTGDILQHSPEAFYIYEPLHQQSKQDFSKNSIQYANGSIR